MHTDDWQLLERFRRDGSQAAFARVVERHVGFVYHVCRRRLRDGHLAEDAAQAVFVVLARRAPLAPLAPGGAHVTLAAWLYRTALHACANASRARKRRLRHETVAAQVRGEAIPVNDDETSGPDERQLERALGALSGTDRDIVLMRFYEDRSLEQIGGTLGISPSTAAKRLSRAVARLRKQFAGAADGDNLRRALCAAAPAGLAGRASDLGAAETAASMTVHEIVKGVVQTMIKIKAKLIAATTGALVLGIGGGVMSVSFLLAQPANNGRAVHASDAQTPAPATAPATTPAKDLTPKQVLRAFGAAIRAGEGARLRALVDARDADTQRLTQVVCDYVQTNHDLRDAVADKFGKAALGRLDELNSMTPINHLGSVIDSLLDHLEETVDGDVATLVPPDPDFDTFVLVRGDGRWKISADHMTAEWTPQMWEAREGQIRRAGEALRALVQGVSDGHFATIEELKEELIQLQRNR